jgi:predicted dehydrogenase
MGVNAPLNRKLRMGLVGGGRGFIGRVHVMAATLDNRAELVAGALSSDPQVAHDSATDFDIPPQRAYGSYMEMAEAEARRPPSERLDFIAIATPNHTHFEIAGTFVRAGFNVMCDKPMTLDLKQAHELARIVREKRVIFAVTHNYTGYPMVRQARAMVCGGVLGDIHAVRAVYLQGSLHRQRTPEQQRRFAWKIDPLRAGRSGCFGDIGIHAYNLVRFITRLVPDRLSCRLKTFMPDGKLDDYGVALLDFRSGAQGTITASRVSHGRENGLSIEIDGARGSLEWHQEEPNRLWHRINGQPQCLQTRDPHAGWSSNVAQESCRLPAGHPEGFLQAFANIYTAAFADMVARAAGMDWPCPDCFYPNVDDGVDGVNFVDRCLASSLTDAAWVSFAG